MKTFLSNNGEVSAVAVVTVLAVEDDVKGPHTYMRVLRLYKHANYT